MEEDFDSTYHDVILQPEHLTEVDYPFPTDESECEPMDSEAVIMSDFERTAVKGPGEKSRTDSASKGTYYYYLVYSLIVLSMSH